MSFLILKTSSKNDYKWGFKNFLNIFNIWLIYREEKKRNSHLHVVVTVIVEKKEEEIIQNNDSAI